MNKKQNHNENVKGKPFKTMITSMMILHKKLNLSQNIISVNKRKSTNCYWIVEQQKNTVNKKSR